MDLIIDSEKEIIAFEGAFSVIDMESVADLLKEHFDILIKWKKVALDLRKVGEIDSSFIQMFLSLKKTFASKISYLGFSKSLLEILKLHGIKIKNKS